MNDLLRQEEQEPPEILYRIKLFKDGNQYCAVFDDFINLQESPAGFGDTVLQAIQELFSVKPE